MDAGFPDEDPEARAHEARLRELFSEATEVAVLRRDGSVAWAGTVAGTAHRGDVAKAAGEPALEHDAAWSLRFGDARPMPLPAASRVASADGGGVVGDAPGGWADPLSGPLAVVRSAWELGKAPREAAEAAEAAAVALLSGGERDERGLAAEIVAVRPLPPQFQRKAGRSYGTRPSSAYGAPARANASAPTAAGAGSQAAGSARPDPAAEEARTRKRIGAMCCTRTYTTITTTTTTATVTTTETAAAAAAAKRALIPIWALHNAAVVHSYAAR